MTGRLHRQEANTVGLAREEEESLPETLCLVKSDSYHASYRKQPDPYNPLTLFPRQKVRGNLTRRLYSNGGISTCSRGFVRSPSAVRPLAAALTQLTTSRLVVCCVTHNIAKSGVKSNFTRFHPLTADDQPAGRLLCEGCCEGSHSRSWRGMLRGPISTKPDTDHCMFTHRKAQNHRPREYAHVKC